MNKDELKARTKQFALRIMNLVDGRFTYLGFPQPLKSAIGNWKSAI